MNGLPKRFGAAVEATRGWAHNTTAAFKDTFAHVAVKYKEAGVGRSASLTEKALDRPGNKLARSKSDPSAAKLFGGKGGKAAAVPSFNPQKISSKSPALSSASGSSLGDFDIPPNRKPAAGPAFIAPPSEGTPLSSGRSAESSSSDTWSSAESASRHSAFFASGSSEEFDIPSGGPPAAKAAVRMPANERFLLSSASSAESSHKPAPQQPKAQTRPWLESFESEGSDVPVIAAKQQPKRKPLPVPPVRKTKAAEEAAAPATVQKSGNPAHELEKGSGPKGGPSKYGPIRPDQVLTEAEKKYEIGQLKERMNELKVKSASNLEEAIDKFESLDGVRSRASAILNSKTQISGQEKVELEGIFDQATNVVANGLQVPLEYIESSVNRLVSEVPSTEAEAINKFESLDLLKKKASIMSQVGQNGKAMIDEINHNKLEEIIDVAKKSMTTESRLPINYIEKKVNALIQGKPSTEEGVIEKIESLDIFRRSLGNKAPNSDPARASTRNLIDASERSMADDLKWMLSHNQQKKQSLNPWHLQRIFENRLRTNWSKPDGEVAQQMEKYTEDLQLIEEMGWVKDKAREFYDSTENASLQDELKQITRAAQEHIKKLEGSDELPLEKLDNTVKAAKEDAKRLRGIKPASNIPPAQQPFIGGFVEPGAQRTDIPPAAAMAWNPPGQQLPVREVHDATSPEFFQRRGFGTPPTAKRTDVPPAGARAWNPPGQQPHAQDARPFAFGGWGTPPTAPEQAISRPSRASTLSAGDFDFSQRPEPASPHTKPPRFTKKEKAAGVGLGLLALAGIGTGVGLHAKNEANRKKNEQEKKPISPLATPRPGSIEWGNDPSKSPESVQAEPPSLNKNAGPDPLNDLLKQITNPGTGQPKRGA